MFTWVFGFIVRLQMGQEMIKWYSFDAAWFSRDMVEHASYDDAIKYIANDSIYFIDNEKNIIYYRGKVTF
jgi:hypothetical protein